MPVALGLRRLALALTLAAGAGLGCRGAPAGPAPSGASAPTRERVALTGEWLFRASDDLGGAEAPAFDDSGWARVTIPHTWAREDPRTHKAAWYRRRFALGPADRGRRLIVDFDAAAAIADVFVNGVHLGQHRGAYTRFAFDATAAVHSGDNVLAVRVSNDPKESADCLPSGDHPRQLYYVYGGITRMAYLLKTADLHVDALDRASPGVYAAARNVSAAGAELQLRVRVRNDRATPARFEVRARLADASGRQALLLEGHSELAAGTSGEVTLEGHVTKPQLWGPGSPALYTLTVDVAEGGTVSDSVSQRIGFRDFRLQGERFVLNGAEIRLRGVSKHHLSERQLSAMTDDEVRADFELLSELGVNTIRLAHYPHSDLAYRLADEKGILVIAENGHSNPGATGETGFAITREMVRQNYNHPSIVAWSVGNEADYKRVFGYARLVREEDPLRAIVYASNTGVLRKKDDDLSFVGQNMYRGWYRGLAWDWEPRALEVPFVTESGGGSVVTSHTDYLQERHSVDVFEPEEYRQLIAEVHNQVAFRDHADAIPLYLTWVFRDFPIDKYKGVLNTKGLVTGGGLRKDAFYLHQAFLRPELPVVHITSQTYLVRRGDSHNGVKVYSNRPALRLLVNGEDRGLVRNGAYAHKNGRRVDNVFYWRTRMQPGRNELVAADGEGHRDSAVVYFVPRDAAAPDEPGAPIATLRSTNAQSPAVYVAAPIREQWPVYAEYDGTADNTWDRIPDPLRDASFIATSRLSKREKRTALGFEARVPIRVFVVRTAGGSREPLTPAGFRDAGISGEWRDDRLQLVRFESFARDVAAGDRVTIPADTRDYVVLIKPR